MKVYLCKCGNYNHSQSDCPKCQLLSTPEAKELDTASNTASDAIAELFLRWLDETKPDSKRQSNVGAFVYWVQQQHT